MDIAINYLAILLAGVVGMALGFAWYSPYLFAKQWMTASGMTPEKMEAGKKRMPIAVAKGFVCQLTIAYVMVHFAVAFGAVDAAGALTLAFWTWIGFVATTSLHSVIWEGKPNTYWFINAGYNLVDFALIALVVVLWR